MQVNQNEDLTPDNKFVIYIDCTTNASSVIHKKIATSDSHNIKKSLKIKTPLSRKNMFSSM